jgi:hypothetical protein
MTACLIFAAPFLALSLAALAVETVRIVSEVRGRK